MGEQTSSSKVRVLICDDQWIVCEGLEAILNTDSQIEVVALAHDGGEAEEKAIVLQPDVILMDLKMPGVNGVQATRRIHTRCPQSKILVLTTYGTDEWVLDAIRSGASGFLLKGTPREALIQAVKETAQGKTHIDPAVAGTLLSEISNPSKLPVDTAVLDALSDRERDVLRLLAHGLSNPDIAARLFLSQGTVRNYVSSILAKLDVDDRTQAALLALRYGLVDLDDI